MNHIFLPIVIVSIEASIGNPNKLINFIPNRLLEDWQFMPIPGIIFFAFDSRHSDTLSTTLSPASS